jgi:hypothetical protein
MLPVSLAALNQSETFAPCRRRHFVVEQKQANGRYLPLVTVADYPAARRYCNTLALFAPVDYRIAEVHNKTAHTYRHKPCTWPHVYFPTGTGLDRRVGDRLFFVFD